MIDPISGAALADALGGLTSAMAGQSLADAYNQRMSDTYTDASGLEIGVGNYTDTKPSISGNTSNTVVDSQESDPSTAFEQYETAGGVVDSTTGGFIYGSNVGTYNYSLMEDDHGDVRAVAPVSVPVSSAYLAIAQALGVSMSLSELDPSLAAKFNQAVVDSGGVYDAARGLVTAWWDGVNMLFPRKVVEAVNDTIQEEGIGPSGVEYPDYNNEGRVVVSGLSVADIVAQVVAGFVYTGTDPYSYEEVGSPGDGVGICFQYPRVSTDYLGGNFYVYGIAEGSTINLGSPAYCVSQAAIRYVQERVGGVNTQRVIVTYSNYSGSTYDSTFEGEKLVSRAGSIEYWKISGIDASMGGEYPEGTSQSQANHYTIDDIPISGGVAHKVDGGQGIDTIDVVPISMPEDPTDTSESTSDPISTPTTPEQEQDLPAPPIPTPIPDTNVSNPDVPLVDSSVVNSTLINELVEELANTVDPQPEQSSGIIPFPWLPGSPVIDPGTGEQTGTQYPSIVPASGSGLIHVYNPTPGEFVGFGNWLWVTYADATIDKIWNNPFDGIIGAHELYATPQRDGRDNIRSGFLVCPVTSDLVRQRYTEIDCGTVIVPEFYGNYFDYSPYSQAYIYLPFIGINEVSIDDIVGHAVNIRYRVDAYNGSCIAMIYVAKSGYRNLCYQFGGNCAVEVPLAGGSQAAIKAGMLQAEAYSRAAIQSAQIQKTASIGSGILNGAAGSSFAGPLAGIIGALAGGTSGYIQGSANVAAAKLQGQAMQEAARYANKSSVQHSGQFGASHGAMGLKNPFIMIRNPIQVKVVNYNDDYGFPAHKRVIIGGCTGYLRVREVNVISAHATNEEKRAIEEELKAGVYVS